MDKGLQPRSNHRGKVHGMDIHAGGNGVGVCAENIGEKTLHTETSAWVFLHCFCLKKEKKCLI